MRGPSSTLSPARLHLQSRLLCPSRVVVKAAESSSNNSILDVKKLGTIPFDKDTETFRDAMAFTGPAPEVGASRGRGVRFQDTFV